MYKIETSIELPIAHCLYRGAYSGLCCGNVYRDQKDDGKKERYDLGDKVFPILHGHNYFVNISLYSNKLDENGMILDFKQLKKIIHNELDQYDHSVILTPDNPLCKAYIKNFKENNIDVERSRLFIWDENPTAEYMAYYWYQVFKQKFIDAGIKLSKLVITVEETSHNKVSYTEGLLED